MPPSSARWLKEHFSDTFVKSAREEGYRSRAVYKLLAIHQRDRLFKPGMTIVELGAAPGSWSQLLCSLIQPNGRLLTIDKQPIEPIEGAEHITGDFTDPAILETIYHAIGKTRIDWVVSDMAPNISGHASIDIPRAMFLVELVYDFAIQVLPPMGGCLIKAFQGEGLDILLGQMKKQFKQVVIRKPKASRNRSREVFILARNKTLYDCQSFA